MTRVSMLAVVFICLVIYGCSITDKSSKYSFTDGYYRSRLAGGKYKKYYLVTGGDSIKVYPAAIRRQLADTVKSLTVLFPPHIPPKDFSNKTFRSHNFDLDVITVIFKYRPPVKDYPQQLNTNFNGALYAGYRIDDYVLSYNSTPLRVANRRITHHGYSFGGFAGVGAARIDEFVTLNRIDYEYDGVVFITGIATEVALNKINFVLLSGLDFLADRNSHFWVNDKKIWIGIGIGLDLN